MAEMDRLKLVGIVDALLTPIQKIIAAVLPDFIEEALESDEVREKIVDVVDKRLVEQFPEARLVPEKVRRRIIRGILDLMLDVILLP